MEFLITFLPFILIQLGIAVFALVVALKKGQAPSLSACLYGVVFAPSIWVTLAGDCLSVIIPYKWLRVAISLVLVYYMSMGCIGLIALPIQNSYRIILLVAFWVFLPLVSMVINRVVATRALLPDKRSVTDR